MGKRLLLASPHMSDEGFELEYVHDAFNKNWIAPLGENVNGFEADMAQYIGAKHTVALSSGTAAIHLAMIMLGIGAGDTVFCQSLTFSASANPIAYLGAKPVFIDSERETWNMDPIALRKAFELYGKPKAVVIVHLYGNPAKLDEITAICAEHDVPLIEDAAEALGSEYNGQKCAIYERYCEGLKGLPVTMQPQLDCAKPNHWLSTLLINKECGITPADMLKHLAEHDMEGRHLWKPMNLQPVFASAPFVKVNEETVCDDLFAHGVCLPSDTKMSMDDVDRVCAAIREMF